LVGSRIWINIFNIRKHLREGFRWNNGNLKFVKFWEDRWIGDFPLIFIIFSRLKEKRLNEFGLKMANSIKNKE
jgi:hypothetical protein